MKEITIKVKGMMCEGCENRVKNALNRINGINEVEANHESGIVNIKAEDNVMENMLEEKIEDIGYEVVKEG